MQESFTPHTPKQPVGKIKIEPTQVERQVTSFLFYSDIIRLYDISVYSETSLAKPLFYSILFIYVPSQISD